MELIDRLKKYAGRPNTSELRKELSSELAQYLRGIVLENHLYEKQADIWPEIAVFSNEEARSVDVVFIGSVFVKEYWNQYGIHILSRREACKKLGITEQELDEAIR